MLRDRVRTAKATRSGVTVLKTHDVPSVNSSPLPHGMRGTLEKGKHYILHDRTGAEREFTVLDPDIGDGCMLTWMHVGDNGFECENFRADFGLCPYQNGLWNATNWVEEAKLAQDDSS